jgi:hypothetical protein
MSDDEEAPVSGRRRRAEGPDRGRIKRRNTLADSSDDEEDGGADNGESSYSSSRMKEAVVSSFYCIWGNCHDPIDFLIYFLFCLCCGGER